MKRQHHGFTLVEMMIVLVIIGILLKITLLGPITTSAHHTVRDQAARLQALLTQMRDKALLENNEFGFSITGDSAYRWWQWAQDSKQWLPLQASPFQPYRLPDDLAVQLQTNEYLPTAFDQPAEQPDIVLYSDGTATPFTLSVISVADQRQTVTLRTDGLSAIYYDRSSR